MLRWRCFLESPLPHACFVNPPLAGGEPQPARRPRGGLQPGQGPAESRLSHPFSSLSLSPSPLSRSWPLSHTHTPSLSIFIALSLSADHAAFLLASPLAPPLILIPPASSPALGSLTDHPPFPVSPGLPGAVKDQVQLAQGVLERRGGDARSPQSAAAGRCIAAVLFGIEMPVTAAAELTAPRGLGSGRGQSVTNSTPSAAASFAAGQPST
jgi:hypothetical protein